MPLFEKRSAARAVPEPAPASIPNAPSKFPSAAPAPAEKASVLGSHVAFRGDLDADEDVLIEGRLEGHVRESKLLRVGPAAHVRGELTVKSAIIAGTVIGNVIASERVEILASGRLEGDIRAPRLQVHEGAYFMGSVEMKRP